MDGEQLELFGGARSSDESSAQEGSGQSVVNSDSALSPPRRGRPPGSDGEPGQLRKLAGEHLVMLEMHMAGWTNIEVAEHFECTPQTVSNVICSDLGRQWIADRRAGMDEEFYGMYGKVILAVKDGLDASDLAIRLTAADKWLKAHGRYSPKRTDNERLTAEDVVQKLLQRGSINITDSNVVIQGSGQPLKELT